MGLCLAQLKLELEQSVATVQNCCTNKGLNSQGILYFETRTRLRSIKSQAKKVVVVVVAAVVVVVLVVLVVVIFGHRNLT